jgi:hypothetical protein
MRIRRIRIKRSEKNRETGLRNRDNTDPLVNPLSPFIVLAKSLFSARGRYPWQIRIQVIPAIVIRRNSSRHPGFYESSSLSGR